MLATFVIGLREGLEAALIIGIIAAFLRRNGRPLAAMWLGVGLGLALSLAVGVALGAVERALPQAGQEALETVIGLVAVVFVTGMIGWMSAHARNLKRELEEGAAAALSGSGALALAGMAFLSVLREGFETSVFLLATFSAASSAAFAAAGTLAGLAVAIVIGWGIYAGGVRINLSRFFRVTGAFLVLVAAGLVMGSLRTAHEAGWLVAGQQRTVDLGWLVAPGSPQSALITGVLGIPADPRLIEVLGWLAYLVPVGLFVLWPRNRRPGPAGAARLKLALAAGLALAAAALPLALPTPRASDAAAPLVGPDGSPRGTARLGRDGGATALILSLPGGRTRSVALPAATGRSAGHDGLAATVWEFRQSDVPAEAPDRLTLAQVMDLNGRRVPAGVNPAQAPGPYDAAWTRVERLEVWLSGGRLLDAAEAGATAVTLSGGGLPAPRVIGLRNAPTPTGSAGAWKLDPGHVAATVATLRSLEAAGRERLFWARDLPLALAGVASVLGWLGLRGLRRAGGRATIFPGRRARTSVENGASHASS